MELFYPIQDKNSNLLPKEGLVNYHGQLFDKEKAEFYTHGLLETIDWAQDEIVMFGKKIKTRRKVSWYGDQPFEYTYSNTTKQALPWTQELLEIKRAIEHESGESFNSCLLNLYHNGGEGMGWHSDDESDLKKGGAIASISFGAERKFVFKHKNSKETVELILEDGSLLMMKDETQDFWLHSLPKSKKMKGIRVNLTFREMKA